MNSFLCKYNRVTTWRSQSNLKKLLKITTKYNGRKYKRHPKKWRHQCDVGGIASRRTTATKRDDEQNHGTNLHAESHHSNIGKARLHQCNHVVAEVCTVHKDAKDLDLPTMTYSKEILPQYRDQLEADFDRTPKKICHQRT